MTGFTMEDKNFEVDLTSAYKELSESLTMENEDKITNDYIQYCLKYDVKKTIEFDKKRRKMIVNFPDHSEEIPLGELFLSFLRCDFSTYETTRQLTIEIYNNPNSDFESAGFSTNLPPFFISQLEKIGITPQEHSKKCVIDKFIKFNIDVHPYFMFFRTQKDMTAEGILNCSNTSEIVTSNELSQEMIDYTKKQKIKMTEAFEVYDVESIAYLEFFKMLEYNLMTRECHNCGKHFIFKGNYDNKYCDRKYIGSRTCQQIGSDKDYNEKVKNSPVWKAQKCAYKRMHARLKNGYLTESQFNNWNKKSVFYRDYALDNLEYTQNFIDWCNDKSVNFKKIIEFDLINSSKL